MKRKLKGRFRYFPGSLYGSLLSFAEVIIYCIFMDRFPVRSERHNKSEIVITVVLILVVFLNFKLGELFFNFTEKMIRRSLDRKQEYGKSPHKRAVVLECVVFFGIILLMTFLPLIMIHFESRIETSVPINGWNP